MSDIFMVLLATAIVGVSFLDLVTSIEIQSSKSLDVDAHRLPEHLLPKEYFILLTPFIKPANFSFNGKVKIIAQVFKPTIHIILHADRLQIKNTIVSLIKQENETLNLEIINITKIEKYEFFNVTMKFPLGAGTNISIDLNYSGILSTDMTGFFRNWYKYNNEKRWILGTQMEPTYARRVFPCFDEPALKAIFHVSIACPQNYSALSNMPLKSRTKDGLMVFEKTPLMPTYLVAVTVSDFKSLSTTDDKNRTYSVWTNSGLMHQLPYALPIALKAVQFFETNLNIFYPLPKLDLVAIPDFPSIAMENWGLHIYSEMLMLYDANFTPLWLKQYIRNLITHETAHQWFGNIVSPKWWNYLWLNEGFAQFFDYYAHDDIISSWNLESLIIVNEMHEAFASDAESTTHPVTHEVKNPSEIKSIFDNISYNKAACLIRMMEKLLGKKIFYQALSRYIEKNKYSVGTPELLFGAFDDEIKRNNYKLNETISNVMNSWTLQAGFPVIKADFEEDNVTLSQKRFFRKSQNVTSNSTWYIPISWASKSTLDFHNTRNVIWLKDNETTVVIPKASVDWIIFNIQQTGFYRVNYDEKMWSRIITLLKSDTYDSVHEINRASIVDDLFNLARAEILDYHLVLNATLYLTQETNYIPWKAALSGFRYLKRKFTGHSELYQLFKVHMITLLEPHYKRLTFDEKLGEPDFNVLLRELVLNWLCELNYKDCIKKSQSVFSLSQSNKGFKISPNQQSIVYCSVIRHGSEQEWNYLWKKYQSSNYAIEQFTILSALACSQNASLLEQLLNRTIDSEIGLRREVVKDVFNSVVESTHNGIKAMLSFIKQNFKKITDYMGDESILESVFGTISELLSTEDLMKKFFMFVKENNNNASSIHETLQSFLQNCIDEFDWFGRNAPKILNWLKVRNTD